MKTVKTKLIKYCPRCKKEVAVQKDGNRNGKQCYKCKECAGTKKRQFVDRKYPIEVRSLAVCFHDDKKTCRRIARIFGVAPNTVCNWIKANEVYKMPDKAQIQVLKNYQEICDTILELKEQLEQILKALKCWEYEKQIKELEKELLKSNVFMVKRTKIQAECNRLEDEKKNLGEIRYKSYKVGKLRKLQSETEKEIREQEQSKKEIENECVFARDNYDIAGIIGLLEKIAI